MVESVAFRYDVDRYGQKVEELSTTRSSVAPVVVGRQRILRTRAKFEKPWSVVGVADVDPEQVDKDKLTAWLATGGRRIGLGDWRPERAATMVTVPMPMAQAWAIARWDNPRSYLSRRTSRIFLISSLRAGIASPLPSKGRKHAGSGYRQAFTMTEIGVQLRPKSVFNFVRKTQYGKPSTRSTSTSAGYG